jgi:hypothetical protein
VFAPDELPWSRVWSTARTHRRLSAKCPQIPWPLAQRPPVGSSRPILPSVAVSGAPSEPNGARAPRPGARRRSLVFPCAGSPRRVQSPHGRQDNHQGRQHALAARPAGPNVPGDGGRRGDAVVARPASGSAGAGGRTRLRDGGLCDLGTRRAAQRGPDGPSGAGQRVGRSPARPAHVQDPRAVHGG